MDNISTLLSDLGDIAANGDVQTWLSLQMEDYGPTCMSKK